MASVATVGIVGNLGADPESRVLPSGQPVVRFSVAVSTKRDGTETTAWYRVSAFGKLAESLNGLHAAGGLAKGKQVYVQGRLEPREYQDREGQVRLSLDVAATNVLATGNRPSGPETARHGAEGADRALPGDWEEVPY